jgi:hypothetical protein
MSGAQAQSASPADAHPAVSNARSATPDGGRNADVQLHIADLHKKLSINPSEETLWSAVAQTMRDNANALDDAIAIRDGADTTAVEDLKAYGDVVQAHADGIKKLSAVFSPLYASMSSEQKKVADDLFAQAGHHQDKGSPQAVN